MELHFNVARHHYVVRFLEEEAPYRQLIPTHAPFLFRDTQDAAPTFTVTIGEGLVPDTLAGLSMVGKFDCGNCLHAVAQRPEGGYRILIHNCDGSLAACFESNADFTDCRVTPHGSITNRRFGIDNSIMIAYAFATAPHDTLLMHASVAVKDHRAYLFLGKSGTGKSTHCELWLKHIAGTERINDDNPVVRLLDNGEVWAFGSPWSGKTPIYKQVGYAIGGFLRLHQAPHNVIRLLSKIEGFANILSSCSTMIWDKRSYDCICSTISKVVASIDCHDQECLPDRDAALLSYTTMSR